VSKVIPIIVLLTLPYLVTRNDKKRLVVNRQVIQWLVDALGGGMQEGSLIGINVTVAEAVKVSTIMIMMMMMMMKMMMMMMKMIIIATTATIKQQQ